MWYPGTCGNDILKIVDGRNLNKTLKNTYATKDPTNKSFGADHNHHLLESDSKQCYLNKE